LAVLALVAASRIAGAATPALAPESIATLRAAAADRSGSSQGYLAGRNLAWSLGHGSDLREIAALLLELRDPRLMESFRNGRVSRYRAPELESLAQRVAEDPSYDASDEGRRTRQLLFEVIGTDYASSELFEAVWKIKKRALLARRQYPSGPPPIAITGPVGMLGNYQVPDREGPFAELIPLLDDACEGRDMMGVLVAHPDVSLLADLRDLYLRSGASAAHCTQPIANLFAGLGTRTATETLGDRLRMLLKLPVSAARDNEIEDTIMLLGPIPAEAQIDLAPLETAVLAAPLGSILRINASNFFEQTITKARRAREYTPENLAYWIGQAHYDIAADFLGRGVDVNPRDKTWGTPLGRALYPTGGPGSRDKQGPLVDTLLARGARVSEPEYDGATPLHYAAAFWSVDEVRLLVEHGADVNARSGKNCKPVTFWADQRTATVLYLLDHGAAINARDCDEATLLLRAVLYRNYELAQQLIERGADVTLGTHDGVSPLLIIHLRHLSEDGEIEKQLRARGATLNPIAVAVWRAKAWMFSAGYR
jgi:hypothetical protein